MGITLNIVGYEMAKLGHVTRLAEGNPIFADVRIYLPGRPTRPETLYVCENASDAASVHEAGAHVLCVKPPAPSNTSARLHDDLGGTDSILSPSAGPALMVHTDQSPLAIFDALLDVFERYDAWQRDMERICHTGGSLQDLLDASEPLLINNVVVLDPALKLIAYTRGTPCDDPITMELIEHGYHTEDNIRKFKLHKRFKPWTEDDGFVVNDSREICKYTTIVKSFKAHSSFSLISVMMCNIVDPDPRLYDVFGMFTDAIGFYALRDYPDGKPSGNAIDSFLNDLIGGPAIDDDAIIERCRYVGLPFEATFCLFYTRPPENSAPITRLLADVSLVAAPAKAFLAGDAVAVLCFNCATSPCKAQCAGIRCVHAGKTIAERLNDMMERYDLACGRSSKFSKLSDVATAFAQAKAAFELIGRITRKQNAAGSVASDATVHNASAGPTDDHAASIHATALDNAFARILPFDLCAMNYLVEKLTNDQIAAVTSTYASSVLSRIAEADAQAGTDNYEFLYAYLALERRTSTVAEALHMHRNNVNYRIGRIEETYGIDVSDPALRLDLLAAYQIRAALP